MNVANNKRKKDSQNRIEKSFIELLQTKEVKDISVSDISKLCTSKPLEANAKEYAPNPHAASQTFVM